GPAGQCGSAVVETVLGDAVVRLGVRDGRLQDLLELVRGLAGGEREHGPGLGHAAPTDVLRDEARLPRRHAHVLRLRSDFAWCLAGTHKVFFFTSVLRSPEWARKVRVGANSPSVGPTICSEMNTGTCLRPSWTAIVCPTISGKTVDVRDQVLIICFWFCSFILVMRPMRSSSAHGPFFEDLLIAASSSSRAAAHARSWRRSACPSCGSGNRASACPTGSPGVRPASCAPRRHRAGGRPGSSRSRGSAGACP